MTPAQNAIDHADCALLEMSLLQARAIIGDTKELNIHGAHPVTGRISVPALLKICA